MAEIYKGFSIEDDVSTLRLTVDGQTIRVEAIPNAFAAVLLNVEAGSLLDLGKAVIDVLPAQRKRSAVRDRHLGILESGVRRWNEWREDEPHISPILFDADLTETLRKHKEPINFSHSDLRCANLRKTSLIGANFHEAILARADMRGANLTRANFCRTDLYRTNLSGARLIRANLQGSQLAKTDLTGARVIGCQLYGLAAWDLTLQSATQKDLVITSRYVSDDDQEYETKITVDDLQVAQFVHLLLNNKNLRGVIDTIGQKGVLILGRFTKGRKVVLEVIRAELRRRGYVPMLFDFEKPTERDFTETILTLAGLSLFIIADISNPRSSPLELQAIMPNYMVPLVPIIDEREQPFSMFKDLRTKYGDWILDPLAYDSVETLRRVFDKAIVAPALKRSRILVGRRAQALQVRHAGDL